MANAAVEKIKAIGLKHGEKAVISLSVLLFLLFVVLALTSKTIDLEPEALAKKAEQAESNLSAQQKVEDILAKLESAGITKSDFQTAVDKQVASSLNPNDFKVASKWVTPEPGAGLIRDQPEIIAPEELYVFPGRGGLLMFALNEKGERIPDTGPDAKDTAKRGAGRRNRGGYGSGYGGMDGEMSGMPGMGGGGPMTPRQKEEAEKARKAEEARLKRVLSGSADKAKEKPKTKEELDREKAEAEAAKAQVVYKEETKGHRWVVISGTLDNKKMKENWLAALKDPSIAYPNYARLEAERQTRGPEGAWGPWEPVDADKNLDVLDNLPEIDEELAPEDVRLSALVDPLPFLRAGYWSGVHVAHLVPKEKREVPKDAAGGGFAGGAFMGPGMGEGGMSAMMKAGGSMGGMSGGKGGMGMAMGMGFGDGGEEMSGGFGSLGMGGGSTGPTDDMNFEKSEQPEVMVRSLDFTVQPDTTYRYRVRIVCYNPNYLRSDVSAGTDTESNELKGPWSKPTEEVTVPADIAAYAMNVAGDAKRPDLVNYQVIRWDPDTGHTVVRNDMAAPGEIVGEYATAELPSSDGAGTTKNKAVDFNSRNVVLDTLGGLRPVTPALGGGSFEVPIVSMLVRPDGTVTVRSQAFDVSDEVRADMDANYRQALKDSSKRRQPGMMDGSGYGGMMMGGPGGLGGMGGMGAGLR
ncbi:MAG: hypothetical protein SFX72_03895 [Isosphaeraceae bacterium]|nr:hypothetical protein [Isosphaeraceae bacterium]